LLKKKEFAPGFAPGHPSLMLYEQLQHNISATKPHGIASKWRKKILVNN
jgi:hypothetical protein